MQCDTLPGSMSFRSGSSCNGYSILNETFIRERETVFTTHRGTWTHTVHVHLIRFGGRGRWSDAFVPLFERWFVPSTTRFQSTTSTHRRTIAMIQQSDIISEYSQTTINRCKSIPSCWLSSAMKQKVFSFGSSTHLQSYIPVIITRLRTAPTAATTIASSFFANDDQRKKISL